MRQTRLLDVFPDGTLHVGEGGTTRLLSALSDVLVTDGRISIDVKGPSETFSEGFTIMNLRSSVSNTLWYSLATGV